MNHETLVVRASCPLNMYLITPGSAVSGFAYWSVGSAIAWDHACKDNFYFVMKESIKFFNSQWQQIHANNIKDKKYHYVRKENCIAASLTE